MPIGQPNEDGYSFENNELKANIRGNLSDGSIIPPAATRETLGLCPLRVPIPPFPADNDFHGMHISRLPICLWYKVQTYRYASHYHQTKTVAVVQSCKSKPNIWNRTDGRITIPRSLLLPRANVSCFAPYVSIYLPSQRATIFTACIPADSTPSVVRAGKHIILLTSRIESYPQANIKTINSLNPTSQNQRQELLQRLA